MTTLFSVTGGAQRAPSFRCDVVATGGPPRPAHLPLLGHALPLLRDPLRFVPLVHGRGPLVRVDIGTWPVYADSWRAGHPVRMDEATVALVATTLARTMCSSDLSRHAEAEAEAEYAMPIVVKTLLTQALIPRALERLPLPANRRFDDATRRLRRTIDGIIAEYRRRGEEREDLFTLLMRAHEDEQRMTDTQVRDELVIIFFAGVETTAATLAWTLYELARHPEIDQAVHAEISTAPTDPRARFDPDR